MANYIELETGRYPVSQSQIRAENPNTSYPDSFPVPEGFAIVFPAPAPTCDPITQIAREVAPIVTDKGHYEQQWEIVDRFIEYTDEEGVLHTKLEQEDIARNAAFKATVPKSVTMRQARLAMLGAGILANVEAAIQTMQSPEGDAARIEWEYAIDVQRDWPLVVNLDPALNLTELQIDNLFIEANKL